ncbi:MAG: hypothetical protein HY901_14105 [Deltaproteobacteria bacterium]|nr:hypothetical protein [Deltaproteobacteria bacterium]
MKEAGWGRDTLDLSVELFLLSKTFESLNAWPHLLPSHYEQIFGLETEKQREWLDEAEKNRWTIRQLAEKLGKKWATTQPGDEPSKDAEPRSFKSELGLARNMVKRFADIQSGLLTLAVEAKLGLTTEELDQGARILIDLEFYLGYLQDKLDTKKG